MQNRNRHHWLDRLGATGSLACAVHCSLLPVLIALLPGLGVSIFASRTVEFVFVATATVLAAVSMWLSYSRHRHIRAKWLLIPGVVLLWCGVTVPMLHDNAIPHAVIMTLGGVLVGMGHVLTLRQNHGHIHDATCAH